VPEPRAEGEPSMSAQIITVAQHKGGAGKTTLAAHLAVSWAEAGRRVALLDTDPQTSLGVWYGQRQSGLGRRAQPLAYAAASGWHVRSELDRLSRISDLVLVDTPPGSGLDIRTSLKSSAAVLVPVQPSPLDLWATQAVLDEIRREGSRSLIVLTRVPARARLTAEVVAELARLQTSIAEARLGNRTAYAATLAAGASVADWAIQGEPWCVEAAREICKLSQEVLDFAEDRYASAAALVSA
jgi:chromosome partitioning protein